MVNHHPILDKWLRLKKQVGHCLCVGLDPDSSKLPAGYTADVSGMTHFLKDIIDVTVDNCIAYKPNISFFEGYGLDGLHCLEEIIQHIDSRVPVILDAKRGDIGNTSRMQARFLFDYFNADASTLHPYMGFDSLQPFFDYTDKYHFVLALTSNPGASDFESLTLQSGKTVYEHVLSTLSTWNASYHNIGAVVGATQSQMADCRAIDDNLVFLIPGVGAQGGSYQEALKNGQNNEGLALINASRSILYGAAHKSELREKVKQAIQSILS
jgi:orotidine-5'-phosphate decarboxylase